LQQITENDQSKMVACFKNKLCHFTATKMYERCITAKAHKKHQTDPTYINTVSAQAQAVAARSSAS
jgi:hypothetical protein